MKKPKKSSGTPGAAYMKGESPKGYKDPACPSSGFVYGHSQHGGKSPSTKVKIQK